MKKSKLRKCSQCNGKGESLSPNPFPDHHSYHWTICTKCKGTGQVKKP